jgi:16S rRNA G966 N2-methylase RsmD
MVNTLEQTKNDLVAYTLAISDARHTAWTPESEAAWGMTNKLYYGDNLDVLRASIASESVDLIYLDPPFNSNASYDVYSKRRAARSRRRKSRRSTTPGTGTNQRARL